MDHINSEDLLFEEPTLEDSDTNQELYNYLRKAREMLQKFYDLNRKEDWSLDYESDGVSLWTRPHENSAFNYCRRYIIVTHYFFNSNKTHFIYLNLNSLIFISYFLALILWNKNMWIADFFI